MKVSDQSPPEELQIPAQLKPDAIKRIQAAVVREYQEQTHPSFASILKKILLNPAFVTLAAALPFSAALLFLAHRIPMALALLIIAAGISGFRYRRRLSLTWLRLGAISTVSGVAGLTIAANAPAPAIPFLALGITASLSAISLTSIYLLRLNFKLI